uniref:PXCC family protein n=1 Tax=Scytodes thoracica TaxID=1112478 RepID=A0A0A0V628_SCYTH|nr:PXCC family protein [Scytodes thoracica]
MIEGHFVKVGDEYNSIRECSMLLCYKNGSWVGSGCATSACMGPSREVPGDKDKPFPGCCPRKECL